MKVTKPTYCKVEGLNTVFEVVDYEYLCNTLVTVIVRVPKHPELTYRVDSDHVTIIEENETKEEVVTVNSFESMTIEGEFYVEKAGDVTAIRVKNGKMSIYKGE